MTANPNELAARRSDARVRLERQLAGSMMALCRSKPYLAGDVLALCPPGCFIGHEPKTVMTAAQRLVGRGEAVDLVSVTREIQALGGEKGMPVHQADLTQYAISAAEFFTERAMLEAAEIVASEWRKDEAAVELERVIKSVKTFAEPVDVALDGLRKAQDTLDASAAGRGYDLDSWLDAYSADLETERVCRPIPSPWSCANRILRGGLLPQELCVLAARPSVGKSALALNWAWSVACSGKHVEFFSLEMGGTQLIDRLAANVGNVDLGSFRQGLSGTERDKVRRAIASIRGKSFNLYEQANIRLGEIRRRVRMAQRNKRQVGLVVVDYLQLVAPDDRKVQREQQVSALSRGFKVLAKDLGVPVLLLAQLSRKGEDANREPVLSDLRESGAIEQDADVVMFLHQARKRNYNNPDEPVKFIVSKGRSSGVGREHLIFRRKVQRFEESDDTAFNAAQREEYESENHWSETEQGDLA